jgi:hypothetical protein
MCNLLSNSGLESAYKLSCEEYPYDKPSAEYIRELEEAETDAWLNELEARYEAEQAEGQRIAALTGKELFHWGLENSRLRLALLPHAHRCRSCCAVLFHGGFDCAEPSHNTCPDCLRAIQSTLTEAYERAADRQWQTRCRQNAETRRNAVTRDGWDV